MAINYTPGKPQENSFVVKAGNYKLRIVEATEDTSKQGNAMIKLKHRIIRPDGSDGPTMFDYITFTPASQWKVDSFLQSCGKYPGEGKPIELDTDDMIGWECNAVLKVEKHDGKDGNKVGEYLPLDDEIPF